jgi:CTP synthase (UTP-ammonia lyase)
MQEVFIALIGDHDPNVTAHRAIPPSLSAAAERLGVKVTAQWMRTDEIEVGQLQEFQAFWCVPASPYRSMEGALTAIRFAREQGRPFLGTCGGFQHAVLEYARNVAGIAGASHAETDPEAAELVITPLACSLVEQRGSVEVLPGSRLAAITGPSLDEEYHCSYGLAPAYEERLQAAGLRVSARDGGGEIRAFELPSHPFFMATLFQPERAVLRGSVHPIVVAFVDAAKVSLRAQRSNPGIASLRSR